MNADVRNAGVRNAGARKQDTCTRNSYKIPRYLDIYSGYLLDPSFVCFLFVFLSEQVALKAALPFRMNLIIPLQEGG